eukprot:TRINITY_DN26527_c0_g1_i1.p1 TRINITY_DN26527_c0_g1~~TRINITY_DN26527_c0_g1_i1.p1  ORF type:complete len:841 (-),score=197.77 TRINITY_DN26527_c0_g1_i1:1482-3722(-)
MEEADALGDSVAIMSSGKLRAYGTPLFLKNRFGGGYQIQLISSESNLTTVRDAVSRLLPQAHIVSEDAGNITLSLSRKGLQSFPAFYRWLEQQKDLNAGVQSSPDGILTGWSFSNSTLEEVFLRLCSQEKVVNEGLEDADLKEKESPLCVICQKRFADSVSLLTKTGIEVVVTGVVCKPCATGVQPPQEEEEDDFQFQEHFEENVDEKKDGMIAELNDVHRENANPLSKHVEADVMAFEPSIFRAQVRGIMWKNFRLGTAQLRPILVRVILMVVLSILYWKLATPTSIQLCSGGYQPLADGSCNFDPFSTGVVSISSDQVLLNYIHPASSYQSVVFMDGSGIMNSFLNNSLANNQYTPLFSQSNFSNASEYLSGRTAGFQEFVESRLLPLNTTSTLCGATYNEYEFHNVPYGFILQYDEYIQNLIPNIFLDVPSLNLNSGMFTFNVYYASSTTIEDISDFHIPVMWNTSYEFSVGPDCSNYYLSYYGQQQNVYSGDVENLLSISNVLGSYALSKLTNKPVQIETFVSSLPSLSFSTSSSDGITLAYSISFMTVLMQSVADILQRLVFETEKDLFFFQRLHGISIKAYWTGHYLYDFLLNFAWACVFFILQAIVGCDIFQRSNKAALIFALIGGCHAVACFSIFLSPFFKKASVARMTAAILTVGFSTLSSFVGKGAFSSGVAWFLSIFPIISLGRCFWIALQWNYISSASTMFLGSFCLMIGTGIVFLFLGILLHSMIHDKPPLQG